MSKPTCQPTGKERPMRRKASDKTTTARKGTLQAPHTIKFSVWTCSLSGWTHLAAIIAVCILRNITRRGLRSFFFLFFFLFSFFLSFFTVLKWHLRSIIMIFWNCSLSPRVIPLCPLDAFTYQWLVGLINSKTDTLSVMASEC